MRCRDCRWFEEPHGRASPCRDAGAKADDLGCEHLQRADDAAKAPVGALEHESYRALFHEVLAESFTLEQDMEVAINSIRAQMQTQGVNASLDATVFQRHSSRVIDLYVLYRLILMCGMGRYCDEIMNHEIGHVFRDRPMRPK
jgi:hypothetical protein